MSLRPASLGAGLLAGVTLALASLTPVLADAPTLSSSDQLYAAGRFDDARKGYEKLVKADPQMVPPRLGLVRALLRLDRWPDALREARAAAAGFPQNADAHGLLALTLMRAGQPEQAAAEAKAALALDKDDFPALIASGRVACWDGRDQEGAAFFRRAAALRPDDPDAVLGLLQTSDDAHTTDAVLPLARTYLKLHPQGQPHESQAEWVQSLVSNESDYWRGFDGDANKPFHLDTPLPPDATYTTTLPIERDGDFVMLPVQINGQAFRLLFDTGAGDDILLSRSAAKRLHLPELAKSYVRGVQGKAPAVRLKADTLALGSVTLRSIPVAVADSAGGPGDGLFGGAILKDYAITLDFDANTMTLSRGPNARHLPLPNSNTATMPLHIFHDYLYLSTRSGDRQSWAMLDTGAFTDILSIRLAKQLAAGMGMGNVREVTFSGRVGVGESDRDIHVYVVAEKKVPITFDQSAPPCTLTQDGLIGESPLDDLISPDANFEVGMLLGVPLLSQHSRVTIDYPHRLLTFEDANPAPKPSGVPTPAR